MQIERSGSVAVLYTNSGAEPHAAVERVPLDLRGFVLQPQRPSAAPHGPLACLDRRDALVRGAMFSSTLALGTASVLCPALSWWALAGLAGGSAGVTAAVQSGLARHARHVPKRDTSQWPLNMQREAMLKTLHALHALRPNNAARAALAGQLRRGAASASGYAAFLRALGPFGEASDTHVVLKCMRWHTLLDWRRGRRTDLAAEPTTAEEASEQEVAVASAARAEALWKELERLARLGEMHLLHSEEGQQAWIEARLAFVLHRGLLAQLLADCPVLESHPEWFQPGPCLRLQEEHVADLISYWQRTPALHDRFVEAVLNPAWL